MSALGDSANYIIITWFVIDVTRSEGALGATLLCLALPRLVFMLAGGVLADRISRKKILLFSLLARAAVLGAFSFALGRSGPAFVQGAVYAMATLFGVVDAFFWPARDSMLPTVVPKEHLAPANSLLQTSQQLSMIMGPLLASLLLRLGSYPLRFQAMALAFLLSALILSTMRLRQSQGSQEETALSRSSVLRDLSAGIRYVLTIRPVAVIMLVALFINLLVMGPLNIALPVLVKQLGWDGSAFGYLEGAVGLGAIAGGLLTGALKGFRGHYRILSLFVAVMGAAIAAAGFMQSLGFGLAAMLVTGLMMSMVNIPVITYIQTVSERGMLGRVMALLNLMSMGLGPVSYALTSFILQHGIATAQVVMRTGGTIMGVLGLSTLLIREFRHMEEHPSWRQVHDTAAGGGQGALYENN